MIDYKSTSGDVLIEHLPSPNLESPISLTWLWEVVVRTKRLPDDLEPKVLFIILRDRLRNPEREVRQHALRVLADLIPVIDQHTLDKHMELILPELTINLSYIAPAVRKGTIDVLRIYLKHSLHRNEVLKKFLTSVPEDSHLMQGLLMAIPYLYNYHLNNEPIIVFFINQLLSGINQDFLRETSICSLVKLRSKLGKDRFNHLLDKESLNTFHELCKEQNIHLNETADNVILETEITLDTGPAITMQIHEETELDNYAADSDLSRQDDSEPELLVMRSPRKVRFGGEVVKMRTPESDSNHQSSDDNDIQTSVIIDRPTSIKITVHDGVTAIKTRHKSMIPVRITTGSNPTTPIRRKMHSSKRLHKSAPELRRLHTSSKIPLRREKNSDKTTGSKQPKSVERKSRSLRRPSRGEDALSPVPIHNEIEVFHNLTRSPERTNEDEEKKEDGQEEAKTEQIVKVVVSEEGDSKENYLSFQVCKDDSIKENKNENNANSPISPLNNIVRDLIHKEDTWTRNRALDDLITLITKNNTPLDNLPTVQFIEALFACEKQKRLQNRAQEVLGLVISRINPQTLQEALPSLTNGLPKITPPTGVRLALLVMEKSSPRKYFDNLSIGENNREEMLRILIAAARTFPSPEINVIKGTQLAFEAMKDPKRGVRQAALETLASLAQVAGNTVILQTIKEMVKDNDESENFVRIVRTRLSRRQLPTVDLNGNIRYSSPREQEEFDWLCGGSLTKTLSMNSIKIPPVANNNYWKRNSRHELNGLVKSPSLELSQDDSKEQLWAVDSSSFPKLETPSIEKATLCPVYVLHRESPQVNGKSYRNYDRGRSNSPPNQRQNHQNLDEVNGFKAKRYFRQNEQFKKSFSSEHIYNKHQENASFSLSSRSSTTSTGSSTKSGIWLREFRSGIPVPISGDTKLKFRTNRHTNSEYNGGPMLAQEPINRTKLESSQASPVTVKNPDQLYIPQIPPASSGSESSGYFTPPADHHLKDPVFERLSSEENNNFTANDEPNFQIVDSENEAQESISILRESSASSDEASRRLDEIICEEINQQQQKQQEIDEVDKPKSFSPLEDVNFDEPPRIFTEPRSKSRSEVNLKSSLPEINERKSINSAPPLNELVAIVPYRFSEAPPLPPSSSPVKTSLPGSVTSNENTPLKSKTEETSIAPSPKRLLRRSISVRGSSIRRIPKSPTSPELRPFTRPKEALGQSLNQMESCEWEIVMQGLNNLIRLSRNHPEALEPHMHSICVALAKNIRNLRSQVARNACKAANELFSTSKRGLDMELEELAGPLLHRTADTNKFLRSDANAALDAMSLNLSTTRVVSVVTSKGSTHQNGVVRGTATRLLSDIAMRIGYEKVYQLPKEIRDKFLLVGANGLTEGSLDTRQHAKALMSTLAKHCQFQKALLEAVPQHTVRHITKIINALK